MRDVESPLPSPPVSRRVRRQGHLSRPRTLYPPVPTKGQVPRAAVCGRLGGRLWSGPGVPLPDRFA
jgi:hypothetical protein